MPPTYVPCRFYPKRSKATLFFCVSLVIGAILLRGWDCDDYALFTYQVATFLNLDCTIKYNANHVWVSVQGIDVNGRGDYGVSSLEQLKYWVEADR